MKADTPLAGEVAASPNHGARKGPLDMLLLHYTGMESAEHALARLCDPAAEVSAHYLVHEDGRIVQMVAEEQRAWHAGAAFWAGEEDINSRSIGIEIVNRGHQYGYQAFPDAQIDAVTALCLDIVRRRSIRAERVLAHSDVAPGRKIDPGEKFPWARLASAGVGHWVEPEEIASGRFLQQGAIGQPVEALQTMLSLYGYKVPVTGAYDAETMTVVEAFQRHFRPMKVDGVADASTITTLHRLLTTLKR
ncbi:N-acetylmuramoyl-L-alanine amidase [Breoghania corrubedonensis]|uniref:N-acetylmuramoyl-L-alanine amidase n=1 Tax=Breoghania corrubedonensis TaxID=665038 RepID=A0A2T5V4Z7_9HYPH|nr:N-acetylmuramoyl-L-alanine amidase [Breoghania corrubedonensis]PTW58819.1 N-acetylmuramoyl-L-alanine amidase [Breoghania corrubedonensis]